MQNWKIWVSQRASVVVFCLFGLASMSKAQDDIDGLFVSLTAVQDNPEASVDDLKQAVENVERIVQEFPSSDAAVSVLLGETYKGIVFAAFEERLNAALEGRQARRHPSARYHPDRAHTAPGRDLPGSGERARSGRLKMSPRVTLARQNDQFRSRLGVPVFGTDLLGRYHFTSGIDALSPESQVDIWMRVRNFEDFTEDNDPYGEHDFGAFDHPEAGKVFWRRLLH